MSEDASDLPSEAITYAIGNKIPLNTPVFVHLLSFVSMMVNNFIRESIQRNNGEKNFVTSQRLNINIHCFMLFFWQLSVDYVFPIMIWFIRAFTHILKAYYINLKLGQ